MRNTVRRGRAVVQEVESRLPQMNWIGTAWTLRRWLPIHLVGPVILPEAYWTRVESVAPCESVKPAARALLTPAYLGHHLWKPRRDRVEQRDDHL